MNPLSLLVLFTAVPRCEDAVTQPDLNMCASAELAHADAALNRQWRMTLEALRSEGDGEPRAAIGPREVLLRRAQRAWIAFRDAHCDSAHYSGIGASLDFTNSISCRVLLTEERTRQLAEMAEAQ